MKIIIYIFNFIYHKIKILKMPASSIQEEAINKFLVEQNNSKNLFKITRTIYSITLNKGPVIKTDTIDLQADKISVSFDSKHKLFKFKYIFSQYEKYNLTNRPSMIKFYRINAVEHHI